MRMDSIYFNCKLNISAVEADVSRGLVFDRDLLSSNPCVTAAKVQATQEEAQLHVFKNRCSLLPGEKPLHKRGWVFQERTLARRIIHFTKDQVFWECWSLEASETLPRGVSGPRYGAFDKSIWLRSETLDAQKMRSRWYDLVQAYSWTSCSYADDRLLAISALAKRFCSALHADQSEYLSGIWKHHLPLSLNWSQDDWSSYPEKSQPAENEPNNEYEYAPSWSWASIIAPVRFAEHRYSQVTTEVVDVEVRRRSPNFFDGTTLCRLRLRGPLCKFRPCLQDGTGWIQNPEDIVFEEFEQYAAHSARGRNIRILWDNARGSFRRDECFLLHLMVGQWGEVVPNHRGLVLLRAAHRGTYERVGIFIVEFTSDQYGSKLEVASKGGSKTLSQDDYLEMDSNGKYTIDLI